MVSEKGSADTVRDIKGFSIKLYTEDGNYDIIGSNIPVFFVKDPMKYSDFIRSMRRDS
jgi:catalase